jgi:hypothetical protein
MNLPLGTFVQEFSGPPENLAGVTEALTRARFAVFPEKPGSRTDPAEAELGWLEVQSHEGGDALPSDDFKRERMEAASNAAAPYRYVRRGSGMIMGRTL